MSMNVEHELVAPIRSWLAGEIGKVELAGALGVTHEWVDELDRVINKYRNGWAEMRQISLSYSAVGEPVGPEDEVVVILKRINIRQLFTDRETRGLGRERGDQEGTISINTNGQPTTIAWKRPNTSVRPMKWGPYEDAQKRLLFVGKPLGILDFDVILVESDEPEREFFQKIADLLKTAAVFAGFAPTGGDAISAALGLGAAVSELIKGTIQDDAELRFLGSLGGSQLDLRYGTCQLIRNTQGDAVPEIAIEFEIVRFDRSILPKEALVFLSDLEFRDADDCSIDRLREEDRVVVDMTVTGAPDEKEEPPRIGTLKTDRPYKGENDADWPVTFGVQDKMVYAGKWGPNVGLNINVSGIPKDINEAAWMKVLQQTGALVGAVAAPDAQASVRRGFEIAEAARSTVVKYLPKTRFAGTLSSLLFVGEAIDGLYHLKEVTEWQDVDIVLDLGDYGEALFRLKVKLAFDEPLA